MAQPQFDQYGFLVTERNKRAVEALEDPVLLRKDNTRLLKWQDMFQQWDAYTTRKLEKLEHRAWKGVPDAVRSELWKRRSAAAHAISTRKYYRLLTQSIPEKCTALISNDSIRTFPTHEFFLSPGPSGALEQNKEGIEKLQKILRAYAVIDQECGYVQGMSYIAAVPLFYMVEEDAYWVFVYMMTRLGFREYFIDGTPQMFRTTEMLDRLLMTQLPRLHSHLKNHKIEVGNFASKWFLTVFTFSLPFPVAIRCWDWLFVIGHDALLVVALSVLKLKQAELLGLTDDKLLECVMQLTNEIDVNAIEFVHAAQQYKGLSREINQIRRDHPHLQADDQARMQLWKNAISTATQT